MKHIYKLSAILLTVLLFTSCDEDIIVYDVDGGQALASFVTGTQTLPVPDTGDSAIIQVGVTTRSTSDRAVTLSVDPSSTADPSEYTIDPSTLVIPAGEFVANVVVNGNFNSIPETGLTSVTFNLAAVDGADILEGNLSNTLNLFRFCPFDSGATFIGDYQLETITPGVFATPTLTDGVVTVSQGATVADRQFSIAAYPAFGSFTPFNFSFSLICDQIVVTAVDNINVGCGGANAIGPSATVSSAYASGDDSELIINFVDDTRGQCTGPHEVQIKLTKI